MVGFGTGLAIGTSADRARKMASLGEWVSGNALINLSLFAFANKFLRDYKLQTDDK